MYLSSLKLNSPFVGLIVSMDLTSRIDGDGGPTVVAVAVTGGNGSGKGSRRAVRWAVDNLFHKADRFVFIHVIPNITSIPTPCTVLYQSLYILLIILLIS